MPIREWTEDLATGIESIDNDHRDIFKLIKDLTQKPNGESSIKEAMGILKRIEKHIFKHFLAEENQMLQNDYPNFLRHRAEHQRLAEYVNSLYAEIKSQGPNIDLVSVSNRLLANWILTHITDMDFELAKFLREQKLLAQASIKAKRIFSEN